MADLGFLPAVRRLLDRTPRGSQRLLFSATLDKADRRARQAVPRRPGHPRGRLGAVADLEHGPPRAARAARAAARRSWSTLTSAPGRTVVFTRTKHGAKALARQLNKQRRPERRAARQPRPERPHPQPRRVPRRQGVHPGRDRHRRPRHPRRRRRARRPRRPAGRAQGLPAPLRPYGAGRRRRHRHHADDRRPGARRPHPDPAGRHQADHHQGPRPGPPDPGRARPGRAHPGPGWLRPAGRPHGRSAGEQGEARNGGGGRNRSRRGRGKGAGKGSGTASGQARSHSRPPSSRAATGRQPPERIAATAGRRPTGVAGSHSAASFSGRR